MKKIIIWSLLLLSVIVSMMYVSCTKETKKTIEYVSMWNAGEPEALFLIDMMDAFEKETGISFNVSWAGRDNLNKLRTRFLSKDEPDLIDQGFSELGALFQDEVLLQPIDDLYSGKGPEGQNQLMDILDKAAMDLYKIQGNYYYYPLKIVTSGFFYDKNIFKQYGLSVPKTWDEFLANGRIMKEKGFPPLALDGTIAFYNAYYFYWSVVRLLGSGPLLDAVADKTGQMWINNPAFLQAAKMVSSLSVTKENFFQPGYSGSSWPAGQSDWALNKSGSILVGSWIASETKSQKTSTFDIGFYPFPLVSGGVGTLSDTEILPFGFAIPKNAKNPDAAKQFLVYISKKENQKKFVDMTDNFSPRVDIEYPDLLKDIAPYMKNAKYHLVYDGGQEKFPEWIATVFYPLDDRLIAGQLSPEDFIKQLAENSKNYWKNK